MNGNPPPNDHGYGAPYPPAGFPSYPVGWTSPINTATHPNHSYGPPPPVPGNHPGAAVPGTPLGLPLPHPPGGAPQPAYQPAYQSTYQPAYPAHSQPPPPAHSQPPPIPGHPAPAGATQFPPTHAPHPNAPDSPLHYLGSVVPDPFAPAAPYGTSRLPGYDPTPQFEAVRKATKGFGTDDTLLISTLVPLNPLQTDALAHMFLAKTGKTLFDVLANETSSWFGMGIRAIALGPLEFDVEMLEKALKGVGTNEALLTELLVGRSSEDLRLLMAAYNRRFHRELISDVAKDLSGKTQRMFNMVLTSQKPADSVPVNRAQIEADVAALYNAGQGRLGTDEMVFCDILINRSRAHITDLCAAYSLRYKSLSKIIKKEFSGHMRDAFLHIVAGAKPKRDKNGVWRDAKLLEASMKGMGTKDAQLVWRVVRAHWDPARMAAINKAYEQRYKKSLATRINGETSGSYKKLMLELVKTPKKK
ncbi:hypothetical protein BD779DRAFT_1546281 [Infundibulicybe gibba]|nr:hypothetical protein BD779DRAFT_1546281 [Infundibulicybe gibba]